MIPGEHPVVIQEAFAGSMARLTYEAQMPGLSMVPRLGVDIHLFSSLSLCFEVDWRIGLWGRTRAQLYFTDGPNASSVTRIDERNDRYGLSMGLRWNFPTKRYPRRAFNNIFQPLEQWGEPHPM